MKCKTCGAELLEVGYPKDFYQKYRCPNGCEEIFSLRVKIQDFLSGVALVIVYLVALLFLAPVLAAATCVRKRGDKNEPEI